MSLKLITAPTAEPITLEQAKAHLRVEISDDDALISALIAAAREAAEAKTQRSLMMQTWELALPKFPCGPDNGIRLLKAPLSGLVSITYVDADGDTQIMAEADYQLDEHSEPARLTPAYGKAWPATRDQANAVVIRYEAGYPDAATVPAQIKTWMLLRIGMLYENRESVSGVTLNELPYVDTLLEPYKIWGC